MITILSILYLNIEYFILKPILSNDLAFRLSYEINNKSMSAEKLLPNNKDPQSAFSNKKSIEHLEIKSLDL